MNKYRIFYRCSNGYTDVEYIYAANRIAAMETFMELGYDDVVSIDCVRVLDNEEARCH